MTSHNRRWAAKMREEAGTLGDLGRAAAEHCPDSDGVIASGFPVLGVWRRSSRLRISHGRLVVHYGIWSFDTPLDNIADVRAVEGHVRITFHRPVHGHEPVGIRHRDLTLAVEDPESVAHALRARLGTRGRSVQDDREADGAS